MLEVTNLHAHYGKSHILHGVDLRVGEGEIVSILGRNGVGRSTTLKAIMGDVERSGCIVFHGQNLIGLKPFDIARRGVGIVPENRDIFDDLTVEQNLLLGLRKGTGAARWGWEDSFNAFPALRARRHTAAGVLSGGEKQMLTICRTLMGNPRLIMVDEPTEGLSPQMVERVGDLLLSNAGKGIAILLVEQKLTIATRISQRLYVMGRGRMVFEGTPAALKANQEIHKKWLGV